MSANQRRALGFEFRMMAISIDNAIPWLLSQHALEQAAVLDGDVIVEDLGHHGNCLRVEQQGGPQGFFLKQPVRDTLCLREAEALLANEAGLYDFFSTTPSGAKMLEFLPKFEAFVRDPPVLVLQLCRDTLPLHEFVNGQPVGCFSADIGVGVGRALATLHTTLSAAELLEVPALRHLRSSAPWVLSIHEPPAAMLGAMTSAEVALLRVVQAAGGLGDNLSCLRSHWRATALIHGDIKADNILVRRDHDSVLLVDWECAQLGPPAWDVGSAFCDLIRFWVSSIPSKCGSAVPHLATRPLVCVRAAARYLWHWYAATVGFEDLSANAFLLESMRYCGARLVQTAFEYAAATTQLSHSVALLLQVGTNILENPVRAQSDLLGLFARVRSS